VDFNIVAPGQLHTAMEAVGLMKKTDGENRDDVSTMKVGVIAGEPKHLSD
jgi:hypothetical protein